MRKEPTWKKNLTDSGDSVRFMALRTLVKYSKDTRRKNWMVGNPWTINSDFTKREQLSHLIHNNPFEDGCARVLKHSECLMIDGWLPSRIPGVNPINKLELYTAILLVQYYSLNGSCPLFAWCEDCCQTVEVNFINYLARGADELVHRFSFTNVTVSQLYQKQESLWNAHVRSS